MNSRLLAVLAVVVLAICGGAIWFLNSQPTAPVPDVPPVASAIPAIAAPIPAKNIAIKPRPTPEPTAKSAQPDPDEPTKEPAKPLAEWEVKIDNVLRANADETQTAQMLINMLPTLPPDGQAEAAQHISNLVLDKDYNRIAPLVKNPGLSEDVLDVFVTDLMNREDDVKLPILLDIAKIPNHPHHEEAATDLQIFLDEDYGQDWAKWDAAMKSYLKKQAAENAAAEKEDAAEAAQARLPQPTR